MLNDLASVMFDEAALAAKCREMGQELARDYEGKDLLVLEIPFSTQLHRTSRGEFLICSNDGNRPIEPYEMATIMAEKGLIVYDQKTWHISGEWLDQKRLSKLQDMIEAKNADSPYLDKSQDES